METLSLASAILAGSLLAGCSATPLVTYESVASPDEKGKLKFVLPRSLLVLKAKPLQEDGSRQKEATLAALSVPTDLPIDEGRGDIYAIAPVRRLGVETHLKVTYIDNSRVMSSVGVQVEDNRVKIIGEIGGAIVAGAGLVALGFRARRDIPERLPVVIDPKAYERERPSGRMWLPLPANEKEWVYRIDIDEFPKDAIETGVFFEKYGAKTTVLPYSGCRDATLYVLKATGKSDDEYTKIIGGAWAFGLKIADPVKVSTVELPQKGKVDMHTACGVNVTSEKSETQSPWSLIAEALRQAKAIRKAYDAADTAKKKP